MSDRSATGPAFDPIAMIETLVRNEVPFVIIGGFAGQLHGSPSLTADLDICHDRSVPALARLATALRTLDAQPLDVAPGLPFQLDERTLSRGDCWVWTTKFGKLDTLVSPAPGTDYASLARTATLYDFGNVRAHVTALDDLIEMKRAANRAKDRIELEVLGALREERDTRPSK